MALSHPVRVVVVGAGYVSGYHIRAIQTLPGVQIVAIVETDQQRAAETAARYGIANVCTSLEQAESYQSGVAHILTPPASHCELTVQALRMGCHVLVEKPMAQTVEECDEMMETARECGRVLAVNHSARFDPAVQKGLALVKRGALGQVLAVDYFRSSDYPPYRGGALPACYREGGYPFRDIGLHGLYLLETFLGEIEELDVHHRSTWRNPYIACDQWRAHASCQNGSGQMHLSWTSRPMQNELLIQGTEGSMRIDLFLETCVIKKNLPLPKPIQLLWNNSTSTAGTALQAVGSMVKFATKRLVPSPDIHASVLAFYQRLLEKGEPSVSPEEGRRMVLLLERAAAPADEAKRLLLTDSPRYRDARILVTGATGFLGGALLRRLVDAGEQVRILARKPADLPVFPEDQVFIVYGDLGDQDAVDQAVKGTEVVYHAGATMNGWWEDFERGTVVGTRNVVEACLRHGVKRLVHVSSLSVLDNASLAEGAHIDERSPVEPYPERRGFYAQSKLMAEKIVVEAVEKRSLQAVIVRPGQIYGRDAREIPPYGTTGIGSRLVALTKRDCILPLVFIENVVDGLVLAAKSVGSGHLVQLVDADRVTLQEYLDSYRKAGGNKKVIWAPKWFLGLAALGLETLGKVLGRKVPLTRYRLQSIKSLTFDCRAAKEALGWEPQVQVREGLQRTFSPGTETPLDSLRPVSSLK